MKKFWKKFFAGFFVLQMLFPGWVHALSESTKNPHPYQENAVIVQYKKNIIDVENTENFSALKNSLHSENKQITEIIPEENIALIEKKEHFLETAFRSVGGFSARESTEDMVRHFQNDPNVEFVQPNFLYKLTTETSALPVNNETTEEVAEIPANTEESSEVNNDTTGTPESNQDAEAKPDNQAENTDEAPADGAGSANEETPTEKANPDETSHNTTEVDAKIFNDPLFPRQWHLENNGNSISGVDAHYRGVAEKIFPEGTEDREEKITSFIGIFTRGEEDVDMDYLEARKIYNTARERLSEEQKQKKILVAIIDDGVNYNSPELDGKMWNGENCRSESNVFLWDCAHGYNVTNGVKDGINSGENFHGTQIASMIAANENNNEWLVGIAPDVEIMAINILRDDGKIYTTDVVKALYFAKNNGADIINLSLGSADPLSLERLSAADHLQYTALKSFPGLIINAAGNERADLDNDTTVVFPAVFARSFTVKNIHYEALPNFVTVGSIQQDGRMSWFSNYGSETVEMIAPGSHIVAAGRETEASNSELENTDYDTVSGTSFAAPVALAAFAFAKSAYPERSWQEIRTAMKETLDLNFLYLTKSKYAGRINLWKMMTHLEEEHNRPSEPLRAEITANTTEWTNRNISLTLTVNKEIHTPQGWKKLSDRTFGKNISENQNITVEVRTDNENTSAFYSVENIDKIAPEVRILPLTDNHLTTAQFNLSFEGNDAQSGISHFECKAGNADWNLCQSPVKINLQSEGEHHIFVRAMDNADNLSDESRLVVHYKKPIDPTPVDSGGSANSNNNSGSSGGGSSGGGGYITTPISTPISAPITRPPLLIQHPNNISSNEENAIFTSAPEKNPSEKNSHSITEIQSTLDKNWIQENGEMVRFSIAKKIHWLKNIFQEQHTSNEENLTLSSATEWEKSVMEIYSRLLHDWKTGKFFILGL